MNYGKRYAGLLLAHSLGKTASPQPSNIYVSVHTADPGEAGQAPGEVTTVGTAYARLLTLPANWDTPTDATPAVSTNAIQLAWAVATTTWGDCLYLGFWDHATATAETNYLGNALLNSGNALTIDTSDQLILEVGTVLLGLA